MSADTAPDCFRLISPLDQISPFRWWHSPSLLRTLDPLVWQFFLSPTGPVRLLRHADRLVHPVVFVCLEDKIQWWKQGASAAELLESIPGNEVERFFRSNLNKFSPEAVYRAKTWGRFQTSYQLSFVDMGLMPLVEEQVGRSLGKLIERNVSGLKSRLGWDEITNEQVQWLLQTVFWLVSAKILRDKQVQSFEDLDLNNVDKVFRRVGNHYGTKPLVAGSKKNVDALCETASTIKQFSSLALTTTEALAYVYETTLISKETRFGAWDTQYAVVSG